MLPPMPRPAPPGQVEGAMALDAQRRQFEGARMPPTLSGQAPTQAPAATPTARAAAGTPAWKIPAIAGAIVAVLIATFLIYRMTRPDGGTESPTASPVVEDAAAKELAGQVQTARKSLDDKNYKEAASQAEQVLQKDPANADAKQILEGAQGALRKVDDAIKTARSALERADTQTASQALSELLALDPSNPAVAEFSARLNSAFRGQAEVAQKTMRVAQREALAAKAGSQPDYAAAQAQAKEADGLFTKGEFATATRMFLEARDGYERARRSMREHVQTPAPPTTVATTLAPVTTVATTMTPATTMATPPPVAVDESVIRRLVGDYKRAIESKDGSLFKSIYPGASGSDEKAIRSNQSQSVDINVLSVQIDGDKATVMVSRRDTAADGKAYSMQQTLVLNKSARGWTIKKIHTQLIGQ